MQISDYPLQEPLPEIVMQFQKRLMQLAEGIEGHEYNFGEDPSQSLIVYPCAQPESPVLIFIHGGGWTNGYKEQMAFLAPPLNAAGFAMVSSGYRLAPKNVFPSNFDDAADAVAMIWSLADAHGYGRDALFIGGHSAGGHLASLLATRTDWQDPRGLPEDVIKGCLPISGTYDFTPGSGMSIRPRFLGPLGVFNEVEASPIFQLNDRTPPFFVSYGSQDLKHLVVQADKFAMVARAKGVAVETLEVDGATHATVLVMAAEADKPWLTSATGWMHAIVRHPRR